MGVLGYMTPKFDIRVYVWEFLIARHILLNIM